MEYWSLEADGNFENFFKDKKKAQERLDELNEKRWKRNMEICGKPVCRPEDSFKKNTPPLEETSNNDVIVEDKRSMIYKVWIKNKNLIMLVGALGVGYFAYKKYYKK